MNVTLRVPGPGKRISLAANLRGHLPAKAQGIEPLDVANGISRFLANQEFSQMARNQPQKTYLKLQAMCLMKQGDKILAKISATQMTQLLCARTLPGNVADNLKPGERLAVLHLYPGGRRLGQFVAFERRQGHPGWKQIPVEEIVPDTRADSYQQLDGKRLHVRTQRKGITSFIALDETSYFLRRARLERFVRGAPADATPSGEHGGPRAILGNIHYRQLAARMASVCRFNRIGYLLIAGTGRLTASIKQEDGKRPLFLTAPAQQFFSVRQSGNRREMGGFLIHALQKAGVTPLFASARARNFWVKPYLQEHTLDGCLPARPYYEDATAKTRRVYTGKRMLISPDGTTPGFPYPQSACWAILLDWSLPEFNRHVTQVFDHSG